MNSLFDSGLKDMIGKVFVLATNASKSSVFKPTGTTVYFKADNDAICVTGLAHQSWKWDVDQDALILSYDKQTYRFDTLESRNGIVYAVANNPASSNSRIILYEQKLLNLNNLGICISSHVKFSATTLPKLLQSLDNSPFDMKKAVVVVADSKEASTDQHAMGAKMVFTRKNLLGFTALSESEHLTGSDRWLLLHDTCEVLPEFTNKLAGIDVGLNPDIVTFSDKSEHLEIGIYSDKFIKTARVGDLNGKSSDNIAEVQRQAGIVLDMSTALKVLPPRDIYGEGVKREVVLLGELGVRKFRGNKIMGGKP